jgi:plastocyanin
VEGNVPKTTVERTEGATRMARLLGLALVALALAVAGCGGGDGEEDEEAAPPPPPAATGGTRLENPADEGGELAFQKDELTAPAGEVTLVMENPSSLEHNIAVKGDGIDEKGPVVGEGGTSEIAVTLEEGEYTFYCSVPGHEAGGMEGTLTVSGG